MTTYDTRSRQQRRQRDMTTTTRKPTPRTPAGAYLSVRRGRRWSSVQVDRISITDADEAQAATVRILALAAAKWCATNGRPQATFLYGPTIWYVTCPTGDLDEALDALLALETNDHGPPLALAARYAGCAGAVLRKPMSPPDPPSQTVTPSQDDRLCWSAACQAVTGTAPVTLASVTRDAPDLSESCSHLRVTS